MHKILAGHNVKSWAEIIEVNESDALIADEVEAELDQTLENTPEGPATSTIKRVEFEYCSSGSRTSSLPSSRFVQAATQRHGSTQVKIAARKSLDQNVKDVKAHISNILDNLGNGK